MCNLKNYAVINPKQATHAKKAHMVPNNCMFERSKIQNFERKRAFHALHFRMLFRAHYSYKFK